MRLCRVKDKNPKKKNCQEAVNYCNDVKIFGYERRSMGGIQKYWEGEIYCAYTISIEGRKVLYDISFLSLYGIRPEMA